MFARHRRNSRAGVIGRPRGARSNRQISDQACHHHFERRPGVTPDVDARFIADAFSKMWGKQVIVVNHPAANGGVAVNPSLGSQISCSFLTKARTCSGVVARVQPVLERINKK